MATMAWHAEATRLLELLTQDELAALHKYYWHKDEVPNSRTALIEEILFKESKPNSLLTRQQITVDLMRRYLGVTKGACNYRCSTRVSGEVSLFEIIVSMIDRPEARFEDPDLQDVGRRR